MHLPNSNAPNGGSGTDIRSGASPALLISNIGRGFNVSSIGMSGIFCTGCCESNWNTEGPGRLLEWVFLEALSPRFQREHGIAGRRVAHKGAGVGLRVAVLVERPCRPSASGFVLVGDQPRTAAFDGRGRIPGAILFESENDEAGRVAIAAGHQRRIVNALPGSQICQRPTAAFVLQPNDLANQPLALLTRKQAGKMGRRPKRNDFVE